MLHQEEEERQGSDASDEHAERDEHLADRVELGGSADRQPHRGQRGDHLEYGDLGLQCLGQLNGDQERQDERQSGHRDRGRLVHGAARDRAFERGHLRPPP